MSNPNTCRNPIAFKISLNYVLYRINPEATNLFLLLFFVKIRLKLIIYCMC